MIAIDLRHLLFVKGIFSVLLKGTYKYNTMLELWMKEVFSNLLVQITYKHKKNYRTLEYINKKGWRGYKVYNILYSSNYLQDQTVKCIIISKNSSLL